jgi:spore coat polysaccharide biosynthesis protein SpsF
MSRVVASVEARQGSSRLPGKALIDIAGQPALTRLLRRLRRASSLDDIVVATSVAAADDAIAGWAEHEGVALYRGSEDDVLARVVEAHEQLGTDVVVEITGDCVLIDPELIDLCVETFRESDCDVVATGIKRSFPLGQAVQVFRFDDLREVERTVSDPPVREHVSLYFYEHPERYRVVHVGAPPRWRAPEWRLHLDYPDDHRFLEEIYGALEPRYGDDFGLDEIMALLRSEPRLVEINRDCVERSAR